MGPDAPDTELVWVTRTGEVSPVDSGWAFDRGGANEGWSLSPDGGRIALRLRQSGNNDIWIVRVDGTQLTQLTHERRPDWQPRWGP